MKIKKYYSYCIKTDIYRSIKLKIYRFYFNIEIGK